MRIYNSLKNISINVLSVFIIAFLGFISRKVFLDSLGPQYLGINGLLDSVLSILALVESGIGTSIVYNLYKPLAENDKPKIIALVKLYKKAYAIIAIIIFLLSIILFPFLLRIMDKSGSISYLAIVYFIFVAKNMTYYLNAHKVSFINADQKGYVLARISLGFQIITMLAKILVLILTKNYLLYLFIELIIFIGQNILNGSIVNKKYPYINTKEVYKIEQDVKDNITKNVKALFFHNIGSYAVNGTDNILISTFVGVTSVGLYSNYSMVIGQLSTLVSPLLSEIGASVGNLIAVESKRKSYEVFKVTYFINFWLYSFCVIFLYNLLEPFINWWLGKGYLLDTVTFVILLINFYISGLRTSIFTFKVKGGIFVQDKYIPIIESIINLGASLILVRYMGIAGIFLGTTLSNIFTVFWNTPYLVYKNIFNKPVWSYFKMYILYGILTLIVGFITTKVCDYIKVDNAFGNLIIKGIICLIIPNLIYCLTFYKSNEFKYVRNIIVLIISKVIRKKELKAAGS